MSFKIGGFLNSLGSDNAVSTPPLVANKPIPERYSGGTLTVAIKPGDTQEKFVYRALYDHAIKAGLGKTEAKEFAAKWTNSNTTFNHRANGESTPYTPREFAALKTKGTAPFDLTKEFDANILADLNKRVDDNTIVVQANPAYTAEERTAMLAQKSAGQSQSAIAEKPDLMLTSGTRKDGKPLDANTALGRYIEKNYNRDGRVWGDKINEMVSQANTNGVKVDLKFNEDGTALIGVNPADKQKLDALFNQALGETIKGEQASLKGQKEATGQVVDIPIMAVRGVVNTANHVTEPVRGTLATLGVDASGLKLPKPEYQSEFGKKNGMAGEIGTEIGLGIVSAPALIKTVAGKVIAGVSGTYNVAAGAAGVDPTEKDGDGNYREMYTLERGLRIVGGAAEVFGARPTFSTAGKTGTALSQTDEVIEALTPDGQIVKVQVPKSAQTASEAAMAKPLQTADDLILEARAAKAENTGPRRNVEMQEAVGGHTIERHVGKSENWLRNRIETDPALKAEGVASSFRNEVIANKAQGQFIKQNKEAVIKWLKSDDEGMFRGVVEINEPVGIVVERGKAGFMETNKVKVFLVKDNSANGWHFMTSFPTK